MTNRRMAEPPYRKHSRMLSLYKILLMAKIKFARYCRIWAVLGLAPLLVGMTDASAAWGLEKSGGRFLSLASVRADKVLSVKLTANKQKFISLNRVPAGGVPLRLAMTRSTELRLPGSLKRERGQKERKGKASIAARKGKSEFQWPVDTAWNQRISSPFGYRRDPFTGKRAFHQGIDIAAAAGARVLASAAGTVETVGTHPRLGKFVKIVHKGGTYTLYGHLKDWRVKEGERVDGGDYIGRIGSTGRSTGPHLDFSVRREGGDAVNPLPLLSVPETLTAMEVSSVER